MQEVRHMVMLLHIHGHVMLVRLVCMVDQGNQGGFSVGQTIVHVQSARG